MNFKPEELHTKKRDRTYDHKSAECSPEELSDHIVAFANADGGTLVIGIGDDLTVTGIDGYRNNVSDILKVPSDYCTPSVPVVTKTIDCIDKNGKPNHLLVMTVPQSQKLHTNRQDEVYYRMGSKSEKLDFDERVQLMYAKETPYYEDEPVYGSSADDIDWDFVAEHCRKTGYKKSPHEYIGQNGSFIIRHNGREELSGAAVLLFAKNPQKFFHRARVRFIRYEGTEAKTAKTGEEINVIKDTMFEGRILDIVRASLYFVYVQIKEYTRLGADGRFHTTPEYPKFAWQELIVNAIEHRDYGIMGTDIQIKMFNDRMTVESPGTLPGIVKPNNLRTVHFSRNPKIARFLREYGYAGESCEGIDRMFNEMAAAGLPAPEYSENAFMLNATIRNGKANT